jgi:dihydroxyacid dehydratase/phosphogluconate dehydratase
MVEGLGFAFPNDVTIPAVDSRRLVLTHIVGRRIVEMTEEGNQNE